MSCNLTKKLLCWWPEEWESMILDSLSCPYIRVYFFLNQNVRFAFDVEIWDIYHRRLCGDSRSRISVFQLWLPCSFFVILTSVCHGLKLVPPVSTEQFHCEDGWSWENLKSNEACYDLPYPETMSISYSNLIDRLIHSFPQQTFTRHLPWIR